MQLIPKLDQKTVLKKGDNLVKQVFHNITHNPIHIIIPGRTTIKPETREYKSHGFDETTPIYVKRKEKKSNIDTENEKIQETLPYDMSDTAAMCTPTKRLSKGAEGVTSTKKAKKKIDPSYLCRKCNGVFGSEEDESIEKDSWWLGCIRRGCKWWVHTETAH